MRYFLEIAFNGTHYFGWQVQPNAITVQEAIENALSTLLGNPTSIVGAGRTDAGVHATQIFAHFDSKEIKDIVHLGFRLNSFLPKDIAITDIFQVTAEAHARFDASLRQYQYKMIFEKDPFMNGFAYYVKKMPNVELMNEAAKILYDHQDFQCFSRSKTDVKTYHCTIEYAHWDWQGKTLVFTIAANRFLRNMVRAIVGTLLEIGYGKLSIEDLHTIIKSKNRSKAGASAPAHGLYLTQVVYPKSIYKK